MGEAQIWQILIIVILIGLIYGIFRFARTSPPAQMNSEGPAGVAGWLLLLVAGLTLLAPLAGAARINIDIMLAEYQYPVLTDIESWQQYKTATWYSYLVAAGLSIYAGFGLAKGRSPAVVKQAKILLWVAGPLATVFMGIVIPFFVFGKLEADPKFFFSLFGSVIAATVWTAYLAKSRRVKATYFPVDSRID